ncbi:hypothetical protein FCO27_18925, partial [Bacillus pumilus]|uniref:hypothetical protein n=1 Tax=Bacillus pumilus TaxID=1408 RepID=UPI0010BE321F
MTDKTTQRFSWSTTGMKVDAEGSFVLQSELASMTRMFLAACAGLGLINEALSRDPEDGGAEPILDAIEELKTKAGVGAEAAQGAAVAINLEGLRERLLAPRMIVRDEDGWLHHPASPICDEGTQADKLLEAVGIEAAFVGMESDAPDLAERWHEQGMTDCSAWTPTPPTGNDWQLLEIYDTEDGPYALFGRDAYTAEQERRKEHTRKLRA